MKVDPDQPKKSPFKRRIMNKCTEQDYLDAQFLDYMMEQDDTDPNTPFSEPPPGEFEKIMAEMQARGMQPRIQKELRRQAMFKKAKAWAMKPVVAGVLAVLLIGGTAMGVSATKSYNYRMRKVQVGNDGIILNNDEHTVMVEDGLEQAYEEIENTLGIKTLKMSKIPYEMVFQNIETGNGYASISFDYDDKMFYFVQAKKSFTDSRGFYSDRADYREVYNPILDETFTIKNNIIDKDMIEYSCGFEYQGVYYSLFGILPEDDFVAIIENLSF